MLDIPDEYSEDAENYVVEQLKELIGVLEERTGRKLDPEELKRTLERENASKAALSLLPEKAEPEILSQHDDPSFIYALCHPSEHRFRRVSGIFPEVGAATSTVIRIFNGKGVLWVHLMPYYQETLKGYFNYQEKYYLKACEMNLDYMEELDTAPSSECSGEKNAE